MKTYLASLLATVLISNSLATLSTPQPHAEKYIIQCIIITKFKFDSMLSFKFRESCVSYEAEDTEDFDLFSKAPINYSTNSLPLPMVTQSELEEILRLPDVEYFEFPAVFVGIEQSVTNDQSTTIDFPVDVDIVDGNVVYTKEPIKIGGLITITLDEVTNDSITYQATAKRTVMKGFDEFKYNVSEHAVLMPYYETRSINVKLTQDPYAWSVCGGGALFRIIPPSIK